VTALAGVLLSLLGAVAFGAVVPIVPTGAAVSGAAAYAFHYHVVTVLLVVAVGAAGAYLGDIVTYAACLWGGERLARRLHWLRDRERVVAMSERLRTRQVPVLLVSRLMPGGRIPVLVAAAVMGLGWRRFAAANAPACLLWAAVYAAIGLLGGSVFPEPWQGVVAAVVLVLLIYQGVAVVTRQRAARHGAARPSPSLPPT
jgi:membrane protein DedA with SNARE-associated domain